MTTIDYYEKRKLEGLCVSCGAKATTKVHCENCREKSYQRSKEYRTKNKELINSRSKARYHKDIEATRKYRREIYKPETAVKKHLKKKYGLSLEAYKKMIEAQNGLCAVCEKPNNLNLRLFPDHNHKTGILRDLLCQRCNTVLGSVDDSISLLVALANYLIRHNENGEVR